MHVFSNTKRTNYPVTTKPHYFRVNMNMIKENKIKLESNISLPVLNKLSFETNGVTYSALPEYISGGYNEDGSVRYSYGVVFFPDSSNLAMVYITLDVNSVVDGQEYDLADENCPVMCYFTDHYIEGGDAYAAKQGRVKFSHSMETYVMEGEFSFDVYLPDPGKAYTIHNGSLFVGPNGNMNTN